MSLFTRRETRTANLDALSTVLMGMRGQRSKSGPFVNDTTAMQLGAVWSSVNLLSDLVATLPVDCYRQSPDGTKTQIAAPTLIANPSNVVSAVAWRRQVMVSWLLRGNVYGWATEHTAGWPTKVEVAHPDDVTVRQSGRYGPASYLLCGQPIDGSEMFHEPAHVVPGSPVGLSPIAYAAESIGLGLSSREFGSEFFGSGGHPTSVLESDQVIPDGIAEQIKARFMAASEGRAPVALGSGFSYKPIQVAPNESQFLETIQANRADIAAYFFPHLILSESANITYANVEGRTLDLLVFDVQPWLVRFEAWLSRMLPRGQFVKFNANALVRTTLKERYEAHKIGIDAGFLLEDEVRDIEDLPPLTDAQRETIATRPKPQSVVMGATP